MLINLRNALMAGRRLPYDAEVEYLESTGTQWIDTGIAHDQTFRWECNAEFTSIGSVNRYIGQSYKTATGGVAPRFAFGIGNNGYLYAGIGNNNNTNLAVGDIDRHLFVLDAPQKQLRVDDAIYTANWTAFSLPTYIRCGLGLFGRSYLDTDGEVNPYCLMRIYSSKHYQDGTLVRDFIPVRVGTVGYLYDRVSGKLFGNAGTGDFVLGQDVVPVEWVRMGDRQYTLFDYTPSADTSCEVKIRPIILNPKNGSRGVFGSEIANNNKSFLVMFENDQWATNLLQFRFGTYLNETDVTQFEAGNLYSIKLNSSGGFVDGIKVVNTKTATPSGSTQTKFGIGCYIRGGNVFSTLGTYDYYGLTIEDGVFSANFRPVRVGTDATSWEGAMMDTLTRRIYRNAGTGAFGYGNDLKYPIPAE